MALQTFSTKFLKTSNLATLAASLAVEKFGLMTGIVALGIVTTTPARAVPSPGPDAYGYFSSPEKLITSFVTSVRLVLLLALATIRSAEPSP